MKLRNRAWRRKEARRIVQRVKTTASWLSDTIQKRKADRPAPLAAAKPHAHGKLTMFQQKRDAWRLNTELRDELMGASAAWTTAYNSEPSPTFAHHRGRWRSFAPRL